MATPPPCLNCLGVPCWAAQPRQAILGGRWNCEGDDLPCLWRRTHCGRKRLRVQGGRHQQGWGIAQLTGFKGRSCQEPIRQTQVCQLNSFQFTLNVIAIWPPIYCFLIRALTQTTFSTTHLEQGFLKDFAILRNWDKAFATDVYCPK